MKRIALLLLILTISASAILAQRTSRSSSRGSSRPSTSSRSSNSGVVKVRGYVRKDGTYVAPHKRTASDGNFDNNWSTYGNVNPYTGRVGTKTTPPQNYGEPVWVDGYYRSDGVYVPGHLRSAPDGDPSNNLGSRGTTSVYNSTMGSRGRPRTVTSTNADRNYGGSDYRSLSYSSQSRDEETRVRKADEIRRLGYEVNWQSYSWLQLSDMENRIRKARDLSRLGIDVDWRSHSWLEMSDWENRINKASALTRLGINVDWRNHTWLTMSDWENRINKAKDLERLGLNLDWREHTWLEMSDWVNRIEKANDLRRIGIDLDWRKYTWLQMVEMERKARSR